MASLRRSKALSPDGQTARFLYTILKQLDLKTIDWNLVADGLDITNGHAARMRFSRFKQHMEGIPVQPRNARPKKDGSNDAKKAKGKGLKRGLDDYDMKEEGMKSEDGEVGEANIKPEPGNRIKTEPGLEESSVPEEPPAVRVKRELETEETVNHLYSEPRCFALPGDGLKQAQAMSLAFAPPTFVTTEATPHMVSPTGTVSLADLHLSTTTIPHVPHFDKPAPNFDFGRNPGTDWTPGEVAVTGIEPGSGWISSPVPVAGSEPHVKSEPSDL